MIDRCPSGTYSYSMTKDGEDIEADLPVQVAATTEITSEGPIIGSLWVTGQHPRRTRGWPALRDPQPRHSLQLRRILQETPLRRHPPPHPGRGVEKGSN